MDGAGSGLSNSNMRLVILAMLNLRIMLRCILVGGHCPSKVLETKKFINKRNGISLLKTLQKRSRISKYRLFDHDTCITLSLQTENKILFYSVAQFFRYYLCCANSEFHLACLNLQIISKFRKTCLQILLRSKGRMIFFHYARVQRNFAQPGVLQ